MADVDGHRRGRKGYGDMVPSNRDWDWRMVGGCAIRTSTYRRICTHMEAEAFDIHLKCLVIIHVFENEMWKMVPLPLIVVTESAYVMYRLRGSSKQFICPFKFYIKPTTTEKERKKIRTVYIFSLIRPLIE